MKVLLYETLHLQKQARDDHIQMLIKGGVHPGHYNFLR